MKRTFWQWLNGEKYLINLESRSVHVIENITKQCSVHLMSEENKMYVTDRFLQKCFRDGAIIHHCPHCFK